ncbi:Rec8 like protein-domain-containing protein [Xylariaceae sp. FL0594]|nr:Rec8 like protein-domain-containing protein [Xylariaceae sp. FL0594]
MFYSHEILTSRQYGVATVWLVATTKLSSRRRVTRKAIQEVDVSGACSKILEPGAPIALRLQGNLLYGVSRVYHEQVTYLIADAERTRNRMKLFYDGLSGNHIDLYAAKTSRESLMIEDDPAFDPNMPLPKFDLDSMVVSQFDTQKTSSQMSPPVTQFSSSQSLGGAFQVQLDIDHSSSSAGHASPFHLEGLSSARKVDDEPLIFTQDDDDVFGTHGDWGIEIDEEGNIIERESSAVVGEEPALPPLPTTEAEGAFSSEYQPHFADHDHDIVQELPLPDAEPLPEPLLEREEHRAFQNDEPVVRPAHSRRRKILVDDETQLSRKDIRRWQTDYIQNCGNFKGTVVKPRQAKRNAMLLTFGLGIGNIGQSISIPGLVHPLASQYSGDSLFSKITGIPVANKEKRGRRRTSTEAMLDDQQEDERRVRPRMMERQDGQEQAREGHHDELQYIEGTFAEGRGDEIGREGEHPMSDQLSSALQPWNRGSSAIPGSSIRGVNSAHKGRDLSSPLGRRDNLQEAVRYSDDAPGGGFSSDGGFGAGVGSAGSSLGNTYEATFGQEEEQPAPELTQEQIKLQTQELLAKLDAEAREFLRFVQEAVAENGERREDDDFDMNRKWLGFDDLFVPRTTMRSTAALAFYNTLCLVTRGDMFVQQDYPTGGAFGPIWLGAKL